MRVYVFVYEVETVYQTPEPQLYTPTKTERAAWQHLGQLCSKPLRKCAVGQRRDHQGGKQWWWDDEANTANQSKRKCWKEWRNGGAIPTREVRKIVHVPKKVAEE